MKTHNSKTYLEEIKNIIKTKIPKSNSNPNINSPYIKYGKLNQKVNYDSKYSLSNFIPVMEYNDIKTIGSGSFGRVYLAKNILDNKIYAIKHMDKKKLLKILKSLKGIYYEIDIQSRIEHENIIRILYTDEDEESFDLVMEYAQKGNLFHYIRKYKGLNEDLTFQLFIQVVNAVYFLHKNDLIHRDIKPENILLFDSPNNKNNILVKLCDFGWCVKLDGESRKTFCGTTEYMSPELIEHKLYSKEIDVWSLGILLYEMIHGYSPFRPNKAKFEEKEVFENIKKHKLKFGKNVSEECKKLIYNLLAFNKNERYKVEDIYNSEFVKRYEKNHLFIDIKKENDNDEKFIKNKFRKSLNNKIDIKNSNIKEQSHRIFKNKSLSKIYKTYSHKNYNNKIKKYNNSFMNPIPNDIYNNISTNRIFNESKDKLRKNIMNTKLNTFKKINLLERSRSLSKESIFSEQILSNTKSKKKINCYSFVDGKTNSKELINIKDVKNRNKNILTQINQISSTEISSKFDINTEKIFSKQNTTNIFEISKSKNSFTNINTPKNNFYKEKKNNRIDKKQKINKKEKLNIEEQDRDTIKLDLYSHSFNKNIIEDLELNNANFKQSKSPEIKKLSSDKQINKDIKNDKKNIKYKSNKKEKFKKFNINDINYLIDKNNYDYITKKITKSNSFNLKTNKVFSKDKKFIKYTQKKINSKDIFLTKIDYQTKNKKNIFIPRNQNYLAIKTQKINNYTNSILSHNITPKNELMKSFVDQKKQNHTQPRKLLYINLQNKKPLYNSSRNNKISEEINNNKNMFSAPFNRINNINYQSNNINNFYIINNNTNIDEQIIDLKKHIENQNMNQTYNNMDKNSYGRIKSLNMKKKELSLDNYIQKVKIGNKSFNNFIKNDKSKKKNKNEQSSSSDKSEKNLTPKKNKDNIKINPIKLLGEFQKEYRCFYNNITNKNK